MFRHQYEEIPTEDTPLGRNGSLINSGSQPPTVGIYVEDLRRAGEEAIVDLYADPSADADAAVADSYPIGSIQSTAGDPQHDPSRSTSALNNPRYDLAQRTAAFGNPQYDLAQPIGAFGNPQYDLTRPTSRRYNSADIEINIGLLQRCCAYIQMSAAQWKTYMLRHGFSLAVLGLAAFLIYGFRQITPEIKEGSVFQDPNDPFKFISADTYELVDEDAVLNLVLFLFAAAYKATLVHPLAEGVSTDDLFCGDYREITGAPQIAYLKLIPGTAQGLTAHSNPFGSW